MYNANGVRTDLTEGGDLSIALHDTSGNVVDELPLTDVSVVPVMLLSTTFNLISLTQTPSLHNEVKTLFLFSDMFVLYTLVSFYVRPLEFILFRSCRLRLPNNE
jgi:hypothetical protein